MSASNNSFESAKFDGAPVVLMAQLSLACRQEAQFVEALKTALTWHFDAFEVDPPKFTSGKSPLYAAM